MKVRSVRSVPSVRSVSPKTFAFAPPGSGLKSPPGPAEVQELAFKFRAGKGKSYWADRLVDAGWQMLLQMLSNFYPMSLGLAMALSTLCSCEHPNKRVYSRYCGHFRDARHGQFLAMKGFSPRCIVSFVDRSNPRLGLWGSRHRDFVVEILNGTHAALEAAKLGHGAPGVAPCVVNVSNAEVGIQMHSAFQYLERIGTI